MNKNTIIAFVVILLSIFIFTSNEYNNILSKYVFKNQKTTVKTDSSVNQKKTETAVIKQEPDKQQIAPAAPIVSDSTTLNQDTIWIENEKMRIGIREQGAIIIALKMKNYQYHKADIDLIENTSIGGGQLFIANKDYSNKTFKFSGASKTNKIVDDSQKFDFVHQDSNGETIIKTFHILKNEYLINIYVSKSTLPGERITLGWFCGIQESEKNIQKNMAEKITIHLSNGESIQHFNHSKSETENPSGRFDWIGVTSKYFFICLNNDSLIDSDLKYESFDPLHNKQFNYKFSVSRNAETQTEKFSIYAGPTERKELKKYDKQYEKVLFPVIGWTRYLFWADKWFPSLADLELLLLLKIQTIFKDYGISILIITIITKIITYPLTISSMKSMERMKDIQPKVTNLRNKFKNNPQKMNEEIMALYKKEGVNPLDPGCLPLFLQMPVFISLFVVLRKAIEIRSEGTILIPWIKDLSQPEIIFSLDKILPGGIPLYGSNFALLPIIMALLTYFQQKMTIKDPNQKMLIYFMPIFMLVLFNSFSSGLVLYWTFSNALQILQQIILNKTKKAQQIKHKT